MAARYADLHAFQIRRSFNYFIRHQTSEAENIIEGEHFDSVLVFDFFDHAFDHIGADEIFILIEITVEHGADERVEIGNVVAEIGRIFHRNEFRTLHDLFDAVFVCGKLSLRILLNFDCTVRALCNIVADDRKRFCQLLVRREYVAHPQNEFVIFFAGCLFLGAQRICRKQNRTCGKKDHRFFHKSSYIDNSTKLNNSR